MADPAAPFATWVLHRVADAVEGAEVSAELLTELHDVMAEVRARPPEAREALAFIDLVERANLPVDDVTELLAFLRAQPPEAREQVLRQFVEAWLVQWRDADDAEPHGGKDG